MPPSRSYPIMLDRRGIERLSLVFTQGQLAHAFGISLPTYRRYVKGREPREAITLYINSKVETMLNEVREKLA